MALGRSLTFGMWSRASNLIRVRGPEKAVEFRLRDGITFTRTLLQAISVEDCHISMPVPDQPGALQRTRRLSYARPSHAQHHGEEFLGEQELVRQHAVVRH